MLRNLGFALFCASAAVVLSGCTKVHGQASNQQNGGSPADPNKALASAESAAPTSIAHKASIMVADEKGNTKALRVGTNGWTCMPDLPSSPGPDPMCWDANAGKWLDAYNGHKPPPSGVVGVIYMLAGGSDAGNTDPYATKPHPGEDWVTTGPHIMIVGSKEVLSGYPAGIKPDTSAPYVMWAGTPYAHLMVPVK